MMKRSDGRVYDELRKTVICKDYIVHAEGSVFIEMGNTRVVCTASLEGKVPKFLQGTGRGWITAEYAMLPRSTAVRMIREATLGRQGGRTLEIQRLIGRSLRAVTNLELLGESTVWIDCDVIQADGGTRSAAITGAFVALYDAFRRMIDAGRLKEMPLVDFVAAVSVGMVDGVPLLDLSFEEDSRAEVDMNVVMTGSGKLIEIQGTAEKKPFTREELEALLRLAEKGIAELVALQKQALL
jgi:ribonuclease PH